MSILVEAKPPQHAAFMLPPAQIWHRPSQQAETAMLTRSVTESDTTERSLSG